MLDERKIQAIEMLVDGSKTKTEIADRIGVSRQAIYLWLNDVEFSTELDNRLRGIKTFSEKKLESKLEYILDELYDIAKSDSTEGNQMAKLKALTYLADRILGKTVSKHELTTEVKNSNSYDDNEIKEVFDQIEDESE